MLEGYINQAKVKGSQAPTRHTRASHSVGHSL